jgi:RNA polymerase sigma-70 factor (ECF subfamily)
MLMSTDDGTLVELVKKGDMDAFGELVERYKNRITWLAQKMVGNYEDAREISQDAFVRVFRSIARFKTGMNFYTWLYQIVSNLCIDHLRKHKRTRKVSLEDLGEFDADAGAPDDPLHVDELKYNVHKVLDKLPEKYKLVIVLRDIEGLSCKEISGVIACSHATVRWRLHRARNLFRDMWNKKFECRKGEHYGLP